MKKITILLLLGFTTSFYVQENKDLFNIEKGTWTVEGNISLFIENSERLQFNNSERDIFNFFVLPRVGYAIQDNLVIWLGIGYGYQNSKNSNIPNPFTPTETEEINNSISFIPYIRKFFPLTENFALSLQAEASYAIENRTSKINSVTQFEVDSDVFFVGVRPGVNYRIAKSVMLQANFGSLGYSNGSVESSGTTIETSKAFNFNLSTSSLLFGALILF